MECNKTCAYGFRAGLDGCVRCECASSACEGLKCPGGEVCEEEALPCLTEPCPVRGICKPIDQTGEKALKRVPVETSIEMTFNGVKLWFTFRTATLNLSKSI